MSWRSYIPAFGAWCCPVAAVNLGAAAWATANWWLLIPALILSLAFWALLDWYARERWGDIVKRGEV